MERGSGKDRPRSGGPRDSKRSERPRSGSRPNARPSGGQGRGRGPRSQERDGERRPRGPQIPEGVEVDDLDPAVLNELRTLPEEIRDRVGKYLVAAEWALDDDDVQEALTFTKEAKRLAGRVACVREAHGITSYRHGDYAEALAELRAVRRMTGDESFVPMMADCERGLGRPERALEALRGFKPGDSQSRLEAAIVAAGARSDLGQHDAALVLLDVPELRQLPAGSERARLQYAYAATLEALGRSEESQEWFARAAESDIDDVTDANTRTVSPEGANGQS